MAREAARLDWTDEGDGLLVGRVRGRTLFELRLFDAETRGRFARQGYVGYLTATLVLRDGGCLTPVSETRSDGHFSYVRDADEARRRCQDALDRLVSSLTGSGGA